MLCVVGDLCHCSGPCFEERAAGSACDMYTNVRRRRSSRSPANLAYLALARKRGLQQPLQRPSLQRPSPGHVKTFRTCIIAMRMHPSTMYANNVCQKPASHLKAEHPSCLKSWCLCANLGLYSAGGTAHPQVFRQRMLTPCNRVAACRLLTPCNRAAACLTSVLLFQQLAIILTI
jgi:hypothetical protein